MNKTNNIMEQSRNNKSSAKNDKKIFKMVNRYMRKYGFDNAFNDFDDWREIQDPKFHSLKSDFIHTAQRLEQYVRLKSGELAEEDCSFTLSFCLLDDCEVIYGPIHKEVPLTEKGYESLRKHVKEMVQEYWDFLSNKDPDGSKGYSQYPIFFDQEYKDNEKEYLDKIINSLIGSNYYCCNGVDKYYGAAFAIDYQKFSLSLKDVPISLFDWHDPPKKCYDYFS